MLGAASSMAARLLLAARPYLFLAANVISLAITAGEIARGIAFLRRIRSSAWRPGSRPAPRPTSWRSKP